MPISVLRYSLLFFTGSPVSVTSRPRKPRTPVARPVADVSQNEQAYALLKERLTTLAYKPGDYLNTAALMDGLRLGRTPINHALHRLSNEGLVQIIPRKGVMVSPLSIDDALDLIDVRLVNEALCVQLAAVRITAPELAEIRALADRFDAAVAARDMPHIMNCDRLFHEAIAAASRNQVLIEILKVLHARSQRFWAISLSAEGHLAEVSAEHQAIIAGLAKGNADAVSRAVNSHVESFRRSLLQRR
jgi:DNA-binding GntR family transcriptional regulator